jgi:hypothetical protein
MVSILDAIRSTRTAQQARETVKKQAPKATKTAQEAVNISFKGIFDALPKPSDLLASAKITQEQRKQVPSAPTVRQTAPMIKKQVQQANKPTQLLTRTPQTPSPKQLTQRTSFDLNRFISQNKTLSNLFGGRS